MVRSSDPAFRREACGIDADYFVDVPYEGEVVRARLSDGGLSLYKGGDASSAASRRGEYAKEHVSPTRDTPAAVDAIGREMHPLRGGGLEQDYLSKEDAPEITYVVRRTIDPCR